MDYHGPGVYKITCKENGKIYVGISKEVHQRISRGHFSTAFCKSDATYDYPLHKDIRRYGKDAFEIEVLAKNIENRELLKLLEQYYIDMYDCKYPNGYNLTDGGDCLPEWSKEQRERFSFSRGSFTEEEIISLRKAYKNGEKPTVIYNSLYKDRISWGGFINVWRGTRYSHIMPEVFENRKTRTKLTEEQVLEIRKKFSQEKVAYNTFAQEYGVTKQCIAAIIKRETWKHI